MQQNLHIDWGNDFWPDFTQCPHGTTVNNYLLHNYKNVIEFYIPKENEIFPDDDWHNKLMNSLNYIENNSFPTCVNLVNWREWRDHMITNAYMGEDLSQLDQIYEQMKTIVEIMGNVSGGRRKTKRRRFNSKKKRNNKKRGTRRTRLV